jgi:hypothetical protein
MVDQRRAVDRNVGSASWLRHRQPLHGGAIGLCSLAIVVIFFRLTDDGLSAFAAVSERQPYLHATYCKTIVRNVRLILGVLIFFDFGTLWSQLV